MPRKWNEFDGYIPLTQQQETYCKCIVKGYTPDQAKRNAGYSASYAIPSATMVKMKARIAQLRAASGGTFVLDVQARKAELSEIATNKHNSNRDRMQAIEILNRMDGLYTAKLEVKSENKDDKAITFAWQPYTLQEPQSAETDGGASTGDTGGEVSLGGRPPSFNEGEVLEAEVVRSE